MGKQNVVNSNKEYNSAIKRKEMLIWYASKAPEHIMLSEISQEEQLQFDPKYVKYLEWSNS